jgi:hypothetical protein
MNHEFLIVALNQKFIMNKKTFNLIGLGIIALVSSSLTACGGSNKVVQVFPEAKPVDPIGSIPVGTKVKVIAPTQPDSNNDRIGWKRVQAPFPSGWISEQYCKEDTKNKECIIQE